MSVGERRWGDVSGETSELSWICPACRCAYAAQPESGPQFCTDDGAALVPNRTGELLLFRIRLDALLAAGLDGGSVWKAWSAAADADVALKIVPTWSGDGAALRSAATRVAGDRHPHILPTHEVTELDEDELIYVSRMARGRSLDEELARVGQFRPRRAVTIIGQVLEALEHAHRRGVPHLDLKPSNITVEPLVARRDFAKVLDFGFGAFRRPWLDSSSRAPDELYYMAPELLSDGVDPRLAIRADLYAAGALLHHLVVGNPPFVGETADQITQGHLSGQPPPIGEIAPGVEAPMGLECVVSRAMSKDPEARFVSAAQMRRELFAETGFAIEVGVVEDSSSAVGEEATVVSPGPVSMHDARLLFAPDPSNASEASGEFDTSPEPPTVTVAPQLGLPPVGTPMEETWSPQAPSTDRGFPRIPIAIEPDTGDMPSEEFTDIDLHLVEARMSADEALPPAAPPRASRRLALYTLAMAGAAAIFALLAARLVQPVAAPAAAPVAAAIASARPDATPQRPDVGPPPRRTATVHITSRPFGAELATATGKAIGETPWKGEMAVGTHALVLRLDGYESEPVAFEIERPGARIQQHVALRAKLSPPDAAVSPDAAPRPKPKPKPKPMRRAAHRRPRPTPAEPAAAIHLPVAPAAPAKFAPRIELLGDEETPAPKLREPPPAAAVRRPNIMLLD